MTFGGMWVIVAIGFHIVPEKAMRTVQMTLDEQLVQAVDKVAKQLRTTRSAFAREALREALHRYRVAQREQQHREGYRKHPVRRGEFSVREREREWGDE